MPLGFEEVMQLRRPQAGAGMHIQYRTSFVRLQCRSKITDHIIWYILSFDARLQRSDEIIHTAQLLTHHL